MSTQTPLIGFIGQGWIGRHYADDFEKRGHQTVRYALEAPYNNNKERIEECDITFIAVPTPTTPDGFDDSILRDALACIGQGHAAVIKSTTLPGTTAQLQADFPNIVILHSPEFLAEKTAAYDAANPNRNLIGLPVDSPEHKKAAELALSVLPAAPYNKVMTSLESELVKYAGNCFLYTKVVFMNILYDLVTKSGGDYEVVREAMVRDPRIGESHTKPVHTSGHIDSTTKTTQRGAGGHCFIKDFEAFRRFYGVEVGDDLAHELLSSMVRYNNHLLSSTSKDLDLLEGVYGADLTVGK